MFINNEDDIHGDTNYQYRSFILEPGIAQTGADIFATEASKSRTDQPGRPIGRTAYYTGSLIRTTNATGQRDWNNPLHYPVNHYINYHTSKDQIRGVMYKGSVGLA